MGVIGFLLLGCAKKQIEGQTFIVTSNGENIKLGLVEVRVFPRSLVEDFVTKRTAEILPKVEAARRFQSEGELKISDIASALKQLGVAKEELAREKILLDERIAQQDAAKAAFLEKLANFQEAVQLFEKQLKARRDDIITEDLHEGMKKLVELRPVNDALRAETEQYIAKARAEAAAREKSAKLSHEALLAAREQIFAETVAAEKSENLTKSLKDEMHGIDQKIIEVDKSVELATEESKKLQLGIDTASIQSASLLAQFFDTFPSSPAIETATSDADGRFKLTETREDVVLVAFSKREVAGRNEDYAWVLHAKDWSPLFLSNKNSFSVPGLVSAK